MRFPLSGKHLHSMAIQIICPVIWVDTARLAVRLICSRKFTDVALTRATVLRTLGAEFARCTVKVSPAECLQIMQVIGGQAGEAVKDKPQKPEQWQCGATVQPVMLRLSSKSMRTVRF